MRKNLLLLITAVLLSMASLILAFTACKKDDSITILKEEQLIQTAYADEITTGSGFTFTANNGYRLFIKEDTSDEYGDVSWMHLVEDGYPYPFDPVDGGYGYVWSGSSGRQGTSIVIYLDTNYTGKNRSASIEITNPNDTQKITISVTQYGTTKDGGMPWKYKISIIASNIINGNSNIARVRANLLPITDDDDGYWWGLAMYKNNGFTMDVFAPPHEYLHSAISEWFPPSVLNDQNANFNSLRFWAETEYSQDIGEFCHCDSGFDSWCEYIYADRSFTAIGNIDGIVYDCSFLTGWNIVYLIEKEDEFLYTTHKPSDINFEWHFYEYQKTKKWTNNSGHIATTFPMHTKTRVNNNILK